MVLRPTGTAGYGLSVQSTSPAFGRGRLFCWRLLFKFPLRRQKSYLLALTISQSRVAFGERIEFNLGQTVLLLQFSTARREGLLPGLPFQFLERFVDAQLTGFEVGKLIARL